MQQHSQLESKAESFKQDFARHWLRETFQNAEQVARPFVQNHLIQIYRELCQVECYTVKVNNSVHLRH
jgi:hypothetical protein